MDYIFTHSTDCLTLLNKRAVTKEILFKYLHSKRITLSTDFTKALLIQKVIEYWNSATSTLPPKQEETHIQSNSSCTSVNGEDEPTPLPQTLTILYNNRLPSTTSFTEESEFPINLLARKFSEWFFNNYNQNKLKPQDFWPDARLYLQITASDGCDVQDCDNSSTAVDILYEVQKLFGFFFNPNLTHAGVQGRMDVHGLVLVLACGTLHTQTDCVGIFECTFGLMRDPFSENNWKTKTIQLMLRSKGAPTTPSLKESDTLREALSLPVPAGELT